MDATPTNGQTSTRPTRGKSATKAKADSPKVTVKPQRKAAPAEQPESTLEPGELSHTIATTAYFLAAARNFEPGHDVEDWLEAERRVREVAAQ